MRISFSAMDTFIRCPLQYKYRYVDRIKTPEKPVLFFGSLIHEVVQYALKKDPLVPSIDELLDLYKNRWKTGVFTDIKESQTYFQSGEKMIKNFHISHQPGLRDIVAIEKRFQMPLGDHTITGQIDRVDKLPHGPFEIIDYKTNNQMPTQQEVDRNHRYKMQLGIYHLATQYSWPEAKDIKLTLYFLKHNQKISTQRAALELDDVKKTVLKTADDVVIATDKREFKVKPSLICEWCDFNDRCPYAKQKYKQQTASSKPTEGEARQGRQKTEEIEGIVAGYIEHRRKSEELERKIHKHFDKGKIERFHHKDGVITRYKKKFFLRQPEK